MNTIVNIIIQYINAQDPKCIVKKTHIEDKTTLNSVCFEILAWLKLERKRELWISEGRKTSLKPLKLNTEYTWCVLLAQLVEHEDLFNETFEIINNQLFLKANLSPEIQSQIRNDAFVLYNPQPILN